MDDTNDDPTDQLAELEAMLEGARQAAHDAANPSIAPRVHDRLSSRTAETAAATVYVGLDDDPVLGLQVGTARGNGIELIRAGLDMPGLFAWLAEDPVIENLMADAVARARVARLDMPAAEG